MTSPEFCDNLLGLADSQHEVVAFAQFGQKVDLLLVVLGNEIHQSCVICKLYHVMGAEGWCVYRSSRFHIVVDYVILQITQKTLLNTVPNWKCIPVEKEPSLSGTRSEPAELSQ